MVSAIPICGDRHFKEIVERAAKLICTTPKFDELAQEVGLGFHKQGVIPIQNSKYALSPYGQATRSVKLLP
jgi:hypothetical protein